VCAPCPDLHYTHYWNYLEKCLYCNVICGERQVEVQQCNATHNRACQCQEGFQQGTIELLQAPCSNSWFG